MPVNLVEVPGDSYVVVSEEGTPEVVIVSSVETEIIESEVQSDILLYQDTEVEIIEICSPCPNEGAQPGGGTSTGGGGALFITNVTNSGNIANQVYEPGTVPANAVMTECTTDTDLVTIHVFAEGDSSFYSPTVTVDGSGNIVTLTQDPNDYRTFTGSYNITVTETRTITATHDNGLTAEVIINRAAAGPSISGIAFGAYPEGTYQTQTAVKENDTISVTVTTDPEATSVTFEAYGAAKATTLPASGGTASGNITISNGTGLLTVRAYATNSIGTDGDPFESPGTLNLDQVAPSVETPFVSLYPNSQGAIKSGETATVHSTCSNFDIISYSTSAGISLNEANNVYAETKTVDFVSGDYVVTGTNYTVSAHKYANDTTTTRNGLVKLVNVAPTVSVSITGGSKLRSSPSGQNYNVNLTSSQQLLAFNSISADKGSLGSITGSGVNYDVTITINDAVAKGTGTFSGLDVVGLSGITGNTISSGSTYTVGGFTFREITYYPGANFQHEAIGTNVYDPTKLQVRYKDTEEYFTYYGADLTNHPKGYSVVTSAKVFDANGDYLFISDSDFMGSNSSFIIVEVEETL